MAKVAIVTGSSSGIGQATAEYFAKKGCQVVITGRNKEKLDKTTKLCTDAGGAANVLVVVGDVTNEDDRNRLVTETMKKFGKIDILVNNAGMAEMGTAGAGSMATFDKIFDTNVRGVIGISHKLDEQFVKHQESEFPMEWNPNVELSRITQLCIPHLTKSKGSIVMVSSIGSQMAFNPTAFYCMSKAALDMYTKCLAMELAPSGVRVNSMNPGAVKTDIMSGAGLTQEARDKIMENTAKTYPLGRVGEGIDIAKGIWFMANSEDSSFVTGQIWNFDGGYSTPAIKEIRLPDELRPPQQ